MLARIRKSMDEKDRGFTLIELLVVMIIIGILAAIAIPVFLNQRKKAVDSSMKSDLRTVANEEETYFTDNQAYVAVSAASSNMTIGSGGNTVRLSNGNTLTVTLNNTTASSATAFCVTATNANGSHAWYYVSSQGGIQPASTTACPSSF